MSNYTIKEFDFNDYFNYWIFDNYPKLRTIKCASTLRNILPKKYYEEKVICDGYYNVWFFPDKKGKKEVTVIIPISKRYFDSEIHDIVIDYCKKYSVHSYRKIIAQRISIDASTDYIIFTYW